MPAFVPRFRDIMAKHGAEGAYYGHCSVGCLHIRPLINLKTQRGLEQVQAMAGEIFDMVLEFEGAISSEHGDGRARSPYLERVFGPLVFGAFRELKAAFDPKNLLNPGNIVASPGITEHMRYGAQYQTWEPKTLLDFREQGGFAAAVEMCNGVGVCRKNLEGTMCPSYMATRDEEHSTRGRANALRAVLSGRVPEADFTGRRLYEVMDLCLECKGCKAECPSNVDMAKMKYEFLHHYYKVHPTPDAQRPLRAYRRSVLVGLAPGAALQLDRRLAHQPLAARRGGGGGPPPAAARPSRAGPSPTGSTRASRTPVAPRGSVVLFHDTFNTYNTPEVAQAAVELLEAAGYRVELVGRKCCGRPLISKGMLEEARAHAEWNVTRLAPWVERGVPVVGLEPSCLLTLRDEYVDLLRTDAARAVARSSYLLEEFLLRERARGLTLPWTNGGPRKALLHGHCHQKAMVGTAPTVAALAWAGYEVSEVDSGCCGMAGAFGFEKEHYDLSVSLGNRRLAPAVRAADRRDGGGGARHLLPPADRAPHRPPGAPPLRGAPRRPPRTSAPPVTRDAEVQGEEPGGSAGDEPGEAHEEVARGLPRLHVRPDPPQPPEESGEPDQHHDEPEVRLHPNRLAISPGSTVTAQIPTPPKPVTTVIHRSTVLSRLTLKPSGRRRLFSNRICQAPIER